jgi:branched-chain amino acid transport system substrate-binding protein
MGTLQPSRRRTASLRLAAAVGAVGLTAAACSSSSHTSTSSSSSSTGSSGSSGGSGPSGENFTLKMGIVMPLTGSLSSYGPSLTKAAELAITQLKTALTQAGLSGVKIQLVGVNDDQTSAQPGVEAAQKLVSSNGAQIIIGSMSSSVTIAITNAVAKPNNVLVVSPTSSDPAIKKLADNHLLWTVYPTDDLQGRALATAVAQNVGATSTVNIVAQNDAYGTGVLQQFSQAWQAGGGKIGVSEAFDPKAPSLDAVASRVASGNPAAYVIVAYPDAYARLAPALVRTGTWSPTKSFATEDLEDTSVLGPIGTAATQGLRGTAASPPAGASADAFKSFFTTNAPGDKFTGFEGAAFDAVVLPTLAAIEAHSSDPTKIRNFMQSVSGPSGTAYTWQNLSAALKAASTGQPIQYQGAWGAVDWAPDGTPNAATYQLWEYSSGKIQTLKTFTFGPTS